ncbi:MAG: lipoprotein [Bacteroidales bacterium]|nr:lipoprotein [Bacteroidales bacterium]
MKKVLLLLFALILLASCNRKVCPAYSDSVNNARSSIFQSGSYRADGINKVYRDSYRKGK